MQSKCYSTQHSDKSFCHPKLCPEARLNKILLRLSICGSLIRTLSLTKLLENRYHHAHHLDFPRRNTAP